MDGLGDIYVADTNNQRVVEVSASGTQTTVGTGLLAPTNLAVDAAGDVYVADQGLGQVVDIAASGRQTTPRQPGSYFLSVSLWMELGMSLSPITTPTTSWRSSSRSRRRSAMPRPPWVKAVLHNR